IDRVSGDASFNGLKLLDGSHDASPPTDYSVVQVAPTIAPPVNATVVGATVTNSDGFGTPGPLITLTGGGEPGNGFFIPSYMVFQVIGFDQNAVDPDSGFAVGPGVYIKFSAYSSDPSFGAAPVYTDVSAVPISAGPIVGTSFQNPGGYMGRGVGLDLLDFNVANLTQADVGATIAFVSTDGSPGGQGQPLQINDGGSEGTVVSLSLPNVSASALNVADISVLPTQQVDFTNTVTGAASSNQLASASAEVRVDAALQQISQARADVGAQTVALNASASDNSLDAVNQTNAESSIRDLNIGQATTQFTRDQVITQVASSVLSQMEVSAKSLTHLLMQKL
ncbi:MAG: flagellin, partial [Rhodanobacteraceae bacterium]